MTDRGHKFSLNFFVAVQLERPHGIFFLRKRKVHTSGLQQKEGKLFKMGLLNVISYADAAWYYELGVNVNLTHGPLNSIRYAFF